VFLFWFCCCCVWFSCVWFSSFSTTPRDWLGRASPKYIRAVLTGRIYGTYIRVPRVRAVNTGVFFDTGSYGPYVQVSKSVPVYMGRIYGYVYIPLDFCVEWDVSIPINTARIYRYTFRHPYVRAVRTGVKKCTRIYGTYTRDPYVRAVNTARQYGSYIRVVRIDRKSTNRHG